jgi:hypothetical protein
VIILEPLPNPVLTALLVHLREIFPGEGFKLGLRDLDTVQIHSSGGERWKIIVDLPDPDLARVEQFDRSGKHNTMGRGIDLRDPQSLDKLDAAIRWYVTFR